MKDFSIHIGMGGWLRFDRIHSLSCLVDNIMYVFISFLFHFMIVAYLYGGVKKCFINDVSLKMFD